MNKNKLLKQLRELGYPLFETEKALDVNETLAEVVKSKDMRLWEGFPLLLANSLERGLFDYKVSEMHLRGVFDKNHFQNLMLMSLALYKHLKLTLPNAKKLYNTTFFRKKTFDKFLKQFKRKEDLSELGKKLSSVRMVNTFKSYFRQKEANLEKYTRMDEEFGLEYALSQVFSDKQKELFMKKLHGDKLTKTEREYYSRSVKKKVLALANSNLHDLALKLVKK